MLVELGEGLLAVHRRNHLHSLHLKRLGHGKDVAYVVIGDQHGLALQRLVIQLWLSPPRLPALWMLVFNQVKEQGHLI